MERFTCWDVMVWQWLSHEPPSWIGTLAWLPLVLTSIMQVNVEMQAEVQSSCSVKTVWSQVADSVFLYPAVLLGKD